MGLLLIWGVGEDIDEQHALVVINPAQAPVSGGDDSIRPPREEIDLGVRRELQRAETPSRWSAGRRRRVVQQAELELVITVREMRHRERLAIVAVAEDAHLFLEHDTLLLPPVWMEQAVKLGVGVAAMEARGKRS